MTNLADLIPAGGGQNNTDFVADGNISAGIPVVLTAAGKAAPITGSGAGAGTPVQFESGAIDGSHISITYDPDEEKVEVAYSDNGNSSYGTAVVGTITSNTTLSFGTPVVFESASTQSISACYDTAANKVVIVYADNGNSSYGTGIVGTVSGTSISFGTAVVYSSNDSRVNCCIFEPNSGKVIIASKQLSGLNRGDTHVGTVSGTSISYGSSDTFLAANPEYISMSYDPDNSNRVLICCRNDSNGYGTATVGSVSGTSMSFGTGVEFQSSSTKWVQVVYDTVQNKHVIFYSNASNNYDGMVIVGTTSGTSVSFGSAAVWKTGVGNQGVYYTGACWDSTNNRIPIAYCFNDWAAPANDYSYVLSATLDSGGTVTFSSETQFESGAATSLTGEGGNFAAFDTAQGSMAYAYKDDTASGTGYALAWQPVVTNLTSTNLLGLAPSAISDTATGTINTWGSRCESSNLLPDGVSAGTAVQYSASNLADKYAADSVYDSTNNKVIVVYDGAGASAGYGIVGTISGTSVSYGSAVQYSGGNARMSQVTYDSTNQRVVVAYSDGANSGYLTVAVGTVSGTSISWGTPVVADSTTNDFYIGIDFDINAGKVLIIWKDNSTGYNYGIVGTVSGTSISFGTKSAEVSGSSYVYQSKGGLVYDVNAQKHLFFRRRVGSTNFDGIVGTIAGTSVTWGSPTGLTTTEYLSDGWGSYDANAQKIVLVYKNDSTTTMGSAVATISGTSVSFGTQVVVDSSINPDFTASYYDSAAQTIVAFGRATNYYGYIGTVSGTSISWTSASTLLLDAAFGYGLGTPAYDANAGKGLILFANTADSAAESAVTTAGTTPLTIASDYYVQTDGTLSTDTGGQLIGKAIATNQINIKDYTG